MYVVIYSYLLRRIKVGLRACGRRCSWPRWASWAPVRPGGGPAPVARQTRYHSWMCCREKDRSSSRWTVGIPHCPRTGAGRWNSGKQSTETENNKGIVSLTMQRISGRINQPFYTSGTVSDRAEQPDVRLNMWREFLFFFKSRYRVVSYSLQNKRK